MILSYEDVEEYLETDGTVCPFCGSDNITADYFDEEGVYRIVNCLACGEYWKDIYQLVGISYEGKDMIVKNQRPKSD
jgi:uncharacterized Zn finger protein